MKVRAAVAYEPNKPLVVEEVDLEGPKAGEVLVKLAATGICVGCRLYFLRWWVPSLFARLFGRAIRGQRRA